MPAAARREVVVTRAFTAPPERVFDAWLDPASARRFLFATDQGEVVRCDIDARVGGGFTIVDRRSNGDAEHVGRYVEIDRPRRLVFEFSVPQFALDVSRITVDTARLGSGTNLTLTADNVPGEQIERAKHGWSTILANLGRVVDPLPG